METIELTQEELKTMLNFLDQINIKLSAIDEAGVLSSLYKKIKEKVKEENGTKV